MITRPVLDYEPETDRLLLMVGPLDNDRAREIPGLTFRQDEGVWQGKAFFSTALAVRGVFGSELLLTERNDTWGQHQVAMEQYAEAVKRADYSGQPWAENLYHFQGPGAALMAAQRTVLLGDEPGTGKTVQGAKALSLIGRDAYPALVVTTKSTMRSWEMHLNEWVPDVLVFLIRGTAGERKKTLTAARLSWEQGEDVVLVIGWGSLRMHTKLAGYGGVKLKEGESVPKELNDGWIKTVIADESHKAFDPTVAQTRALWGVGDEAENRFALTGTPYRGSPIDTWATFRFLKPGMWTSKSKFQDRYVLSVEVRAKGRKGATVSKPTAFNPQTLPELQRITAPYMIRRTRAEVLPELPPKVYETRWLDLEAKQRKTYNQMADKMVARLESGLLVVTSPLEMSLRLIQIASAMPVLGEPDEGGIPMVEEFIMPSAKVDALVEDLDGITDPWIVFAESTKLLDLAQQEVEKKLKIPTVRITGDVSDAERDLAVAQFQRGDVPVIFMSSAGSEGITLTAAGTVAYLQRFRSLIHNVQSEDRALRIGQVHDSVRYIDYVTLDTIEEKAVLDGVFKEEQAQAFLEDPLWIRRALGAK